MQKYNVALIPNFARERITHLAQLFSEKAEKYLLGDASLPHITLYQFWENKANIETTWQQLCGILDLQEKKFNFTSFNYFSRDQKIFYISLIPDNIKSLHQMHSKVATILHLPIKKDFEPHMTLFNTYDGQVKLDLVKMEYLPIRDSFTLALGRCDEVGQFVKTLYINV